MTYGEALKVLLAIAREKRGALIAHKGQVRRAAQVVLESRRATTREKALARLAIDS